MSSLPDTAEYWADVRCHFGFRRPRSHWHGFPPGVPRVKLAKFQSPYNVPVTTACGIETSLAAMGGTRDRPVSCRACLAVLNLARSGT